MATDYQVRVGQDLLRRAGLGADQVTDRHLAMTPHRSEFVGTVANWLAAMPANEYADVLDEAHRRIGGTEFVRAERAVALLTDLLGHDDHRPVELAGLRPYHDRFGTLLRSIEHSYAQAAARKLIDRAADLLDYACWASHSMSLIHLPLNPADGGEILARVGRAIRAVLVWRTALHGRTDTLERLTRAADAADW